MGKGFLALAAVAVGLTVATAAAGAQDGLKDVRAAAHFPNPLAPYLGRSVAEPNFGNAPRIDTLLKDGRLYLSLTDAVALALENNLDLAIARYNLSIADTDILRAKSGAAVRGVDTGLVQGTPGGGVGGFGTGAPGAGAGGTTGGAGGAGGGASGLVQSTLGAGAPIESYDPTLNAGLNINHVTLPLSNTVLNGVSSLAQNQGTANFNYTQAFASGTSMAVDFNNDRITTNSINSTLVPELDTRFRLTLRQHLLSGFGFGPNLRFIRIARNNREISDVAFRGQVIATVSQIENIYWDLVNAYEDVNVKQRSLGLAEKTLADTREQARIGALPTLDVTRAENEVAGRNQDLILSQNELQLEELLIKNAITRDLSDTVLASTAVVPTDTMTVPEQESVVPVQDLLNEALNHRPELAEARIDLTNREISRKAATNAMRPVVDLVGWYGAYGLAGLQNPANTCTGAPNGTCTPAGSIPRSGYSNAFASLFKNNFPDYAVGISVSIPIRNRAAQADQIRSQLEFRQAQLHLQQLQNQIGIEVRNAQFALQQNRSRVVASRKARDLAQSTLEIEQKKYALGASTSNQVLGVQRDLAQAESNFVAAMSAYEKSRVELDRATGLTLAHTGLEIQDAESGELHKQPYFEGVVPRAENSPTPPPDHHNL